MEEIIEESQADIPAATPDVSQVIEEAANESEVEITIEEPLQPEENTVESTTPATANKSPALKGIYN